MLTFISLYDIKVKRYAVIVMPAHEFVKIFYLIGGTHNVHYNRKEGDR